MQRVARTDRHRLAARATEIRLRCLRDQLAPAAIADIICAELPELFPLETWRLAHAWSRAELSARLDALYQADGLATPGLTGAELCRWEHAQRRPSDERIEYLCRVYSTRPDRLGFGIDFSTVDVGHLASAGISDLWPKTTQDSFDHLANGIRSARQEISMFGLTRNFYASDEILPLFEARAIEIPVTFYVMDPNCYSRKDRYRLEPGEAAMEDPARYIREILRPLFEAASRVNRAALPTAGLRLFTYNFPCSFALEKVDQSCRVMLYGHGKRGTEGPIIVFEEGTQYWDYFTGQFAWFNRLAEEPREPWISKNVVIRPLTEGDLVVRNDN